MTKIFIIFSLLTLPLLAKAAIHTSYLKCSRTLPAQKEIKAEVQTVIVATETLTEKGCKTLGKNKAEQFATGGWKCMGANGEAQFSCESEKPSTYAIYKGIKLDHLTFTNLEKRRSIVAYINPDSNGLCHEDQAEITSAGVKDAICHKRDAKN